MVEKKGSDLMTGIVDHKHFSVPDQDLNDPYELRWSTSQVIQPARLPACARGKESMNKEPADVREPISETPSLQKHVFIRKLGSNLLDA